MKTLRTLLLVSFAALMFANTGCKKYEEGPVISFRSKKARVVNDWKVDEIYKNGTKQDLDNTTYEITFNDDNTGEEEITYQTALGNITSKYKFNWEFNEDKTKIILSDVDDNGNETGETSEITILKLFEKEFWYEYKDDDDTYEYHLLPK